jgi:hypothetical protein
MDADRDRAQAGRVRPPVTTRRRAGCCERRYTVTRQIPELADGQPAERLAWQSRSSGLSGRSLNRAPVGEGPSRTAIGRAITIPTGC